MEEREEQEEKKEQADDLEEEEEDGGEKEGEEEQEEKEKGERKGSMETHIEVGEILMKIYDCGFMSLIETFHCTHVRSSPVNSHQVGLPGDLGFNEAVRPVVIRFV
ncbi:hypothetical protein PHLCEN_2v3005 [Hermanssonia centrifuga]|uniref:Uncharacterized protein n=1 Tax=Hermanssonia centrifuga TaxID=98765 RepID=A0A2R6R7D8_9APHY|nr:hypothetical protein PHLCEN_2v3005 [Hermanssonia centrifuga]